jgi:Protein of unknown function (DUF2950)
MMKLTPWLTAVVAVAAFSATPQPTTQRSFATPEQAVTALVSAVRAKDVNGLLAVVGPKSKDWLFSGDDVADTADWKLFLTAYDLKHRIDQQSDAKAVLMVGNDDWPFPAPLLKSAGQWQFDVAAGRDEVLNRRIGRNELDTIQTMLAIVDAQREYALTDADGNGLTDYAMRFRSTPGKKDGLYWQTQPGETASPLGLLVAEAVEAGYGGPANPDKPRPYHGYYYRMLMGQGKAARDGAFNYLVNGKLFGGFAVVASPASYGNSGVETYIVNHEGVVYRKALGPDTASITAKMKLFDPGDGWEKVP